MVWTDAEGITFAKFEPTTEGVDLGDASSLASATTCTRVPWARVRKVQKSESRALHVEDVDGKEQFATFSVDELWAEVQARAPGLRPKKVAAPSIGAGWWVRASVGVGVVGGIFSALVFWLSQSEALWDPAHGRVRVGAVALVWILRAVAWVGPWPWVALTVLAVCFGVIAAMRDGRGLPQDDVLIRE